VIRPALPEEIDSVSDLVTAAYSLYLKRIGRLPAPILADYPELINAGSVFVLPAESGLRAVVVMMPDNDGMFVQNIAVHPDSQSLGLGRRLMDFVERSAREQGLSCVHLYTNETMVENLDFYERLGYREVDRRIENGYRRVYFRKELIVGA
jgi:ribosomal protein S18 acetylase RimI-like enzyme